MAQPQQVPIRHTIEEALTLCGVLADTNNVLFNAANAATRISADVFNDNFSTCMDLSFTELEDSWKTYSGLTINEGRIRLLPGTKVNIKAFVQWVRDQIRIGNDPALSPFPVGRRHDLLERYNTHKQWLADAPGMLKSAMPKDFTEKIKWADWKGTFINFLKTQPGRHGVPLSYVVRDNDAALIRNNPNFLDDYVDQAPLNGRTFASDAEKVHAYLARLLTGNSVAEQKLLPHNNLNDGRVDFNVLKDYYEGVGANAKAVLEAETDIQNMFYSGEKRPTMWWDQFEARLTNAFAILDKDAGHQIYTDVMKLRMLNTKVKADFLTTMKTNIEIQMNVTPMTMNYEAALTNYRNIVNQRFPYDPNARKTNRRVQSTTGRGGRGPRTSGRGDGQGGRGGRGRGRGNNKRSDAWEVIGINGKRIQVHPSYRFEETQWYNIPEPVRKQLMQMRKDYQQSKRQKSDQSSYQSGYGTGSQQGQSGYSRQVQQQDSYSHYGPAHAPLPPPPAPGTVMVPPPPPPYRSINQVGERDDVSQITQNTPGNSIMGGRNAQSLRSRNPSDQGRSIRNVITKRKIGKYNARIKEPSPNTSADNEADTNADTCCLGCNFIPIHYTNRTADVYPYNDAYEPIENVPIVSGATAYDHKDGSTSILIFNEALYYGDQMKHSLINPNQVRFNGLDFWDNPLRDDELFMEITEELRVPLRFKGTKCVFKSRVPTKEELDTCPHFEITSPHPWEPNEVDMNNIKGTFDAKVSSIKRHAFKISTGINNAFERAHNTVMEYAYLDPSSDEAILSAITPSLVQLKELSVKAIQVVDHPNEQFPARRTFVSRKRHAQLSAEALSELWHISPKRAKATMNATTQHGIRSAILPLTRRYRSDRMYNVKRLRGRFATDTFFADMKSLHGNTCCQIFSHKIGFAACYPKPNAKGDSLGEALDDFVHDFGAPEHLTFDGHQSQVGKNTHFNKSLRKYQIDYHVSAPRRPNENPAEGAIREIKRRFYRIMNNKRVPKRVWDYLVLWVCETASLTVSSSKYANGRTPIEVITGETPDISEYLDFGFYDWVIYRSNAGLGEPSVGRWLGVSHKVGQMMSYWVLPMSAIPISCVNVQRMTEEEQRKDEYKEAISEYNEGLKRRLEAKDIDANVTDVPDWNRLSMDESDPDFNEEFNKVISDDAIPEADDTEQSTPEIFDQYINMELALPQGDGTEMLHAKVKRRALDYNGRPIGKESNNPITDTRLYEVEFIDGTTETMSANIIAQNILSQVDEEGHRQLMMDEITDHRSTDEAVREEDAFYITESGLRRRRNTTKGWEVCIQWKDGSSNWVALKDVKNTYPVELAEYAVANQIHNRPAFAWWVPYTLRKRKAILKKIKSKYWQRTHKYGVLIPKSVKQAYEIDEANGDTVWRDAINKEMPKIVNAVAVHDGDPSELIGYQQISGHIIFDVKLGENFRRKARFVADGHKTDTPPSVTYSTVVSRDSVRICLTLAALNDLDILAGDIENAYLSAPCREKVWLRGGDEFGHLKGKVLVVRKALYGLKSSGAAFRAFLAEKLDSIGFKSSIADPDVWMRPATKPTGEEYYEYMLCYVDDILCISYEPNRAMDEIRSSLKFKNDKTEEPEFYLGANLKRKVLNGKSVWTMSSADYLKAAIENVEAQLKDRGERLPTRATTPMVMSYRPEIDDSHELDPEGLTHFQELIGILRWACEIGRVDILTEVSMLSSYQASPRIGHLHQVYHIFAFLKKNPKLTIYFNPEEPNIDPSWFQGDDADVFKEQYRDAEEQLPPPHMCPKPRGRQVNTTAYVDSSHAANRVTRRSHTGFILFLMMAPIVWFSKRQNTVEASTFSSEFIAAKVCIEHITALRFKLRMFGVPLDGPTRVLCDNESVVKNSSLLSSTLNKKHSSIAYHSVRWNVAAGVVKFAWIDGRYNLADAMTKRLSMERRQELFGGWTY
jgi:hypothetical protein